VDGRLLLVGEDAGALHHDVDAEVFPRQLGRVLFRQHLERALADIHRVALDLDLAVEAPMDRIISEQMRVGLDRAEVVDGDELQIPAIMLDHGAQNVASDASETVDCDLDCHENLRRRRPDFGMNPADCASKHAILVVIDDFQGKRQGVLGSQEGGLGVGWGERAAVTIKLFLSRRWQSDANSKG
jgi:hypothetical protein